MFKKIEIWILYLCLVLSIIFSFAFAVLVRQELEGYTKIGSINIEFLSKPATYLARLPERFLMEIIVEPFRVDDPWKEKKSFYNQTGFEGSYDTSERYLLLSRFDGDIKQGVIELIDLRSFKIIHSWNPDIDHINALITNTDEFKYIERDDNDSRKMLVHPILLSDLDLFFGWYSPIRKIDACSKLVWQNDQDAFHHSIEEDIDGNFWAPIHLKPSSLSKEEVGSNFLDDAIAKFSKDGDLLYKKSVAEILIENGMEYLLFAVGDMGFTKNPIHLNDIQPVNFDGMFWRKGDLFLSLRHQSMVLLYRPTTNEIIWKSTGNFYHQHDVDIINEHTISVFNNNSKDFFDGDKVDGHNEIIIYDFIKNQYSSYLKDSLAKEHAETIYQGRSEILPNGDLFFEETDNGRILFFDANGLLKWSYVNRSESQKVYQLGWSRILYLPHEISRVNELKQIDKSCD